MLGLNPNVVYWKDKEIPKVSSMSFETNYKKDPIIEGTIRVWHLDDKGEHVETDYDCYLNKVTDYKFKRVWQVDFRDDSAKEIALSPYATIGDYCD